MTTKTALRPIQVNCAARDVNQNAMRNILNYNLYFNGCIVVLRDGKIPLLCPYSKRDLNEKRRIFNYRLTRVRCFVK